jgi:ribosomal RNA-processing protein 12
MAQNLGNQLKIRKDLRIDILSSIRQLIWKNLENEENRKVLTNFSQNYLPILYNLYTTMPVGSEEKGQRLAVLETIKLYLRIAPKGLVMRMFDNAFTVYDRESGFIKESTLDILQAQLPYQDHGRIEKLYLLVVKEVGSQNHTEQKKAYKILEEIFSSTSEDCSTFVADNLLSIQEILLHSLSKASPSSQRYRLRCLVHIIRKLSSEHKDFAFKVVPEAVLCIKAVNAKARAEAFTLIVCVGEMLFKWNKEEDDNGEEGSELKEYMEVLFAGLAGSPSMINCSILAITRVFYEFRDIFPEIVTEMLVNNVCLLLTSQAREVVGSCLSFLRVFVTANPVFDTVRFLEPIMKAMVKMSEDCKRHFRIKSRFLLERLVRKFGFDLLSGLVPKDDLIMQKRLRNIRKVQTRKAKEDQKKLRADDSDDDEEGDVQVRTKAKNMDEIMADLDDSENDEMDLDDGEDKSKTTRRKKKSKHQTFISEKDGTEEGIVDFLDVTAAQKVTSVRPKTDAERSQIQIKRQRDKNGGFEIASDGRLIIRDSDGEGDDEEDRQQAEMKRRQGHFMEDSDEEESGKNENTFRSLVESSSSARKRKMGGSVASSRRTNEPSVKYQAGGTGIHRPVSGSVKSGGGGGGGRNSEFGSDYRSTKAKGDVKRKGKPDPYAYVPLQKGALNRRKKAKYAGQFENVVKAAQSGADQGAKGKGKLAKQMKKMKV